MILSDVARLLAEARAAHQQYRASSGLMKEGRRIQAPNLLACGQAVQAALSARTEAISRDPQHDDPAWQLDRQAMRGASNEALVTFYAGYLAR